jgi:hypothetical protein
VCQGCALSSRQHMPGRYCNFLFYSWCSACYGVLRFIMESGAKGCEVIVSGKLRAQRAKAMKFKVCPPIIRRTCCAIGVMPLVTWEYAHRHTHRHSLHVPAVGRCDVAMQDGYMISSGQPVNDYIDGAVRHVMLRQGVLGIKVGRNLSRRPVTHADACRVRCCTALCSTGCKPDTNSVLRGH